MPKENICRQLKCLLRRDIGQGNREYKSLIRDIKSFEKEAELGYDRQLINRLQTQFFMKIRGYKFFDEEKLSAFAEYLQDLEGQKHVFIFYQREEIPYPRDWDWNTWALVSRDISFDVDQIKQRFSDSTITTHFLFLTNELESTIEIENFNEQRLYLSGQTYAVVSAFHEVSKTTGGITYASGNPFTAFKNVSAASENYYLLYYSPQNYKSDGKFKGIKLEIKGRNYWVLHRAGYIAD